MCFYFSKLTTCLHTHVRSRLKSPTLQCICFDSRQHLWEQIKKKDIENLLNPPRLKTWHAPVSTLSPAVPGSPPLCGSMDPWWAEPECWWAKSSLSLQSREQEQNGHPWKKQHSLTCVRKANLCVFVRKTVMGTALFLFLQDLKEVVVGLPSLPCPASACGSSWHFCVYIQFNSMLLI